MHSYLRRFEFKNFQLPAAIVPSQIKLGAKISEANSRGRWEVIRVRSSLPHNQLRKPAYEKYLYTQPLTKVNSRKLRSDPLCI